MALYRGQGMASTFGERLRDYRKLRCLSQAELAECLGVALNMISKVEHGMRKVSFDEAIQIAAALEVSLDALAGMQSDVMTILPPGEREGYQLFKEFCQKITAVSPPPQKGTKSYSLQKYGTSYQKVHTIVPKWHFV